MMPNVHKCGSIAESIKFIRDWRKTDQNNKPITNGAIQTFKTIEDLPSSPKQKFQRFQQHFAEVFDCNLGIIAFDEGKFTLDMGSDNRTRKAYICFNKDQTIRGPLYEVCPDGSIKTVFSSSMEDFDFHISVHLYVCRLNDAGNILNQILCLRSSHLLLRSSI